MPASASVGRSGRAGSRFAPVVASARSLPALICGRGGDVVEHHVHLAAEKVGHRRAAPLYGICRMLVSVICVNIAADMWMLVPLPLEA